MQHTHPHGRPQHNQHQRTEQPRKTARNRPARGQSLPKHTEHQHGEIGRCRQRESQPDHKGHILILKGHPEHNRRNAQSQRGRLGNPHLFVLRGLALADDRSVQIMAYRRCARQRQPGHHRQNRGEGNGRNKAQQQIAARSPGQVHRHIRAAHHFIHAFAFFENLREKLRVVAAQENNRAKADDDRQQVEITDKPRSHHHRLACFSRIRHGEKAHQNVRQPGRAEHQCETERQRVHRVFDQPAGRHDCLALFMRRYGLAEHGFQIEPRMLQHKKRHQRRPAQQQHRLNHLNPCRCQHPAEQHIGHHQHAHQYHGGKVAHAEQKLNQLARTHHLRD